MKKGKTFLAIVAFATCLTACEDAVEPIDTKVAIPVNVNKRSFAFSNEGGSDSLYVKGHKYMNLYSMSILADDTTFLCPDIVFKECNGHIIGYDGKKMGSVAFDGALVREIETEEYRLSLLYDKEGKCTYTYLIEGKPTDKRKTIIHLMCTTDDHPEAPSIEIR